MLLIVGAGPVGLASALELARRGIELRIIDKAETPSKLSKAIGVNPRTLELLEPSGASAQLLESGTKVRRANLHEDDRHLATLEFEAAAHRHNYMLALPQSRTEAVLADTLQGYGVQVERGCCLTRLVLRNGRVRCLLETRGRRSEVQPSLVIGADGAHSIVRDSLRITFPGRAYNADWTLLDVRLEWGHEEDEVNLFASKEGLVVAIPIGPGRYRLAGNRPDLTCLLPKGARVRQTLWQSSFRIAHRQARTYQKGPVYLAGDAAHIHSPLGARGMNMGIEDAAVLAGLLAAGQPERYHGLRFPVGRRAIRLIDLQTRALSGRGPVAAMLRQRLVPALLGITALRQRLCRGMLGLATPLRQDFETSRSAAP